jgi:hypothetical protein
MCGGQTTQPPMLEIPELVKIFNNTVKGLRSKTEVWCHTCWGNPAQQRIFRDVQSYQPTLEALNQVDARPAASARIAARLPRPLIDRVMFRCGSVVADEHPDDEIVVERARGGHELAGLLERAHGPGRAIIAFLGDVGSVTTIDPQVLARRP